MYFPDREKPVKKHWMSVLCKSWLYIMQSDQTQTELVENMTARFLESGSYLPEEYVDNHSLSLNVDTSDEWIRTRTGIAGRHIAKEETTSQMAGGRRRQGFTAVRLETGRGGSDSGCHIHTGYAVSERGPAAFRSCAMRVTRYAWISMRPAPVFCTRWLRHMRTYSPASAQRLW